MAITKRTFDSIVKKIHVLKEKVKKNQHQAKLLRSLAKTNKTAHFRLQRVLYGRELLKEQIKELIQYRNKVAKELKKKEGGKKKVAKHSGQIQDIMFDTTKWTPEEAHHELLRMGFKPYHNKMDVKEHHIRFEIVPPDYKKYEYRTIWFSEPDGIKAVYGFPKGSTSYYTGN